MDFLEMFQENTKEFSGKTAIVDFDGRRSTTYSRLYELGCRVAAKLGRNGSIQGQAVIVCMDRRMEYIAAEIGIIMAGAAFVPVLPEYPEERILYIKNNCNAAEVIDIQWFEDIMQYQPAEPVNTRGKDRVLIIYTSGSTGKPKGIVHTMASFTDGMSRAYKAFGNDSSDIMAASAPMSFIALVFEYYNVLYRGGTVHILAEETRRDVRLLEKYYADNGITCGFISPQLLKYFKNRGTALRRIATGSERVSMLCGDGYDIYNIYGMSETAVLISFYKITAPMENTPIGVPGEGVEISLLDNDGNKVPDGETGEICVKGIFAECYLGLGEQSAKTFIKQEDGTVLVHTGDMGKKLPDGNYVYVNRKDWMVKVNGQRVETGEIETRMSSIPGVENAVVKAFADKNGQNYLCGYYVAGEEVKAEKVRKYLEKALPGYMVPRFIKRLESLPKNVNGKLDRMALPEPGISEFKAEYKEPANNIQKRICLGFEEVLHCGKAGRTDDFFKLGGDSINVLKLAEFLGNLGITPGIILAGRTPENIEAQLGIKKAEEPVKCGERKSSPLTDAQMGVYLECINEPDGTMYNIPMCCTLPADTGRESFKQAVKKAVAMHRSFGVMVKTEEGTPVMEFHKELLEAVIEEKEINDQEIEEECRAFVKPFNLEKEPLYRMAVYYGQKHAYFLFDVHHIIFDGTSVKVFLDEISMLYSGKEPAPEEISLMDMGVYEETLSETGKYKEAQEFFRNKLGGVEAGEMLLKDRQPKDASFKSNVINLSLGGELSCMEAGQFVKQKGISENTLFLGAFAYALGKYSGEKHSLFCTVDNGRHVPGLAESAGMFVKTLPIYQSWEETVSVEDYLQDFQEDFYKIMEHDCISFSELAKEYGIASDILFVYQGEMLSGLCIGGKDYPAQPVASGDVQADISVMVMKSQDGYNVSMEYRKDLYNEDTIKGLANMFLKVLKGMVSCSTLGQIKLVSELDLQLLDSFNNTEVPFDRSKTVVEMFKEQAKAVPDNTAVVSGDKTYTYKQLDSITDRIASYITGLGIGREQVVSVLVPRCEYMVAASLGILKAGAAYQPLDPAYPKERLEFMIKDADAKLLVADESLLKLVPGYSGQVLLTKDIGALPEGGKVETVIKPEDLFILLYTSGSTGVPKGCMLEHGNIAAFCHWYKDYYKLSQESRVAAYASYGFDANMMDMYPALTYGASVYIIDEGMRLDLAAINNYFEEQGITHAFMTTQIGRAFATSMQNSSLKHLSMGGEALVPFEPEGSTNYYNVYGPTECTILSTTYKLSGYEAELPIGKALNNMKFYITDSVGRRVPPGVPGELCIAGYQVSRGYLNRPEKTQEAYSANPFCNKEGYKRLYHTGDIVRFKQDGTLQFIGRRDGQVKIRGFRIELSEVEEIIRRFPGIKDAAVAAFDEPSGGKYIAAYVVSDKAVDIQALEKFIAETKPAYMVPAVTMQIGKIPLNQNQKVDKRALPVPERKQEELVPPGNEAQQKIFECIAEVTGHKEFGITTDIYKAGLTSIGAVRLNVLLSKAFEGAVIRNKDLKENNTIIKLESFIKGQKTEKQFAIQEAYPLTQTQNGIFVECAANPGSTIYNIPFLFRLDSRTDILRLERAIGETVEAHPYIKTTLYLDENGDIWQKRNDNVPFEVQVLNQMPEEDIVKPYNILGDRLFRVNIYDTDGSKFLFLEFHHIISDGTSCGIFIEDMNAAYSGSVLEKEQFSGYEAALLEQERLKGVEYQLAKKYYDSIFKDCDTDFLPAKDYKEGTPGAGNYSRPVQADINAIENFCKANKITMNALFTAAFGFVTGRYVYKDEAVFTTIYNGRNDSRLTRTINMLVKTLPVYCSINGEQEIITYIKETGRQLMDSMDSDIYSFAEISRAYGIKADIMFAFQGDNFQFNEIAGGRAELKELSLDTAKAPLSIDVTIDNNNINYIAEYRSDMYEESTIAGIIDSFAVVVSEFMEKKYLKDVCMVSSKARQELDGYNQTDIQVGQATANMLFERQVQLYPDRTAVIACGEKLTFKELNDNANKIANRLLGMGLKTEDMAAVMLPRTTAVYAARQGVLKAGGAFLPIDPEYPDERISYIMEDSGAKFIIMPGQLAKERAALIKKLDAGVLVIEEILSADGDISRPDVEIKPENLCYCIYTSGSTGKPKGVMIEHRNLVNYVDDNKYNVEAQAYINNATVSLAFAAITFDVSILEECIPLYHGITVCMANEEEIHNPLALSALLIKNGVDMLTCTPSFLINIIDMPEMKEALSQIKVFNVGAEAFPDALYNKIKALGTDAVVYNGYGPTETTIGCAFDEMTGEKVTIGKPMANIKMMVIDKNLNLLPAGVPGELLIIGNGVGRGYVGRPELTADKFITFEGMKAYRSGDLAKWNKHGKIEFMGRMDNQVKLRGLRVELDEIENVMNQYPSVKSSVVLVKEKDNNQFLCGYFVAGSHVETSKLVSFMQKYLTPYMVPGVLMQLEELPLTNNGKVNKRALPEPEYRAESSNYVEPRTELQKKLCEIFAMALGVDKVGIEDDFFENGGTSLSASKVAMKCMSAGIQVAYADLFDYKTPLALERHIQEAAGIVQQDNAGGKSQDKGEEEAPYSQVLKRNKPEYAKEVKSAPLGDVLLTGATGFLGAHVLQTILEETDSKVYCLVRKGKRSSMEERLKSLLVYYFSNPYSELFGSRIILIEGDITDRRVTGSLEGYPFGKVINCAACVKHFSADDTLEQVNYQGVLNLIDMCRNGGKELIQISTVSIAGENAGGKLPAEKKLHEDELYFGQRLGNKYIDTKFRAEKAVLEAVSDGMKGKVIRVGNLMSRVSDGEFQINSVTNGFMRTLRGYAALGQFPVSLLDMPAEFSPVDSTAQAIVHLAAAEGGFSVFHAYSSYMIQMADVTGQMNASGIKVEITSDEIFQESLLKALGDDSKNSLVSGLVAYMPSSPEESAVYIDADNSFTTKVLYQLGFKWPMPDKEYLGNALKALVTLGFFDA